MIGTSRAALLGAAGASSGGGYHADAVHFDGSTYLSCASLTSTDNLKWSQSWWFKIDNVTTPPEMWVVDPATNYSSDNFLNGTPAFGMHLGDNSSQVSVLDGTTLSLGVWYNLLFSVDAGAGNSAFYITDSLSGSLVVSGTTTAFVANGLQFTFGGDTFGNNFAGDMADLWIAPGTSLLSGNAIPEATRRKFISATGKPVDPSGFPAGGAVLFSGNAASFATNQGSGGTFTTTGTLTNASTSPSG